VLNLEFKEARYVVRSTDIALSNLPENGYFFLDVKVRKEFETYAVLYAYRDSVSHNMYVRRIGSGQESSWKLIAQDQEVVKTYADVKLQEAKVYTDSKVAGIQSAGIGLITFKFEKIAQCVGYEFTDTLYKGYKAKVTASGINRYIVQLVNVWTNNFLSAIACSNYTPGPIVRSLGVNCIDIYCDNVTATVYVTIFNGGYNE